MHLYDVRCNKVKVVRLRPLRSYIHTYVLSLYLILKNIIIKLNTYVVSIKNVFDFVKLYFHENKDLIIL